MITFPSNNSAGHKPNQLAASTSCPLHKVPWEELQLEDHRNTWKEAFAWATWKGFACKREEAEDFDSRIPFACDSFAGLDNLHGT